MADHQSPFPLPLPPSASYPPPTFRTRPSNHSLFPTQTSTMASVTPGHHPLHVQSSTYPPVPPTIAISPMTNKPKAKPRRRKRRILQTIFSILYHASFYIFILIIATLLLGAAYGFGEQAWRSGGQRRWNIVVFVGSYFALGLISIVHVWSRVLSIKKILRTMPKPYMPTKQIDVPKSVANHITTEYSRTAIIAHISQATKGQQEGWGRPGTKWENQHFRTYILNSLPTLRNALCPDSTAHALSIQPLVVAADQFGDKGALRLFINSYGKILEAARYGRREPTEEDATACEKIIEIVLLTLEMKRRREAGELGEGTASRRE